MGGLLSPIQEFCCLWTALALSARAVVSHGTNFTRLISLQSIPLMSEASIICGSPNTTYVPTLKHHKHLGSNCWPMLHHRRHRNG
ncbi:uncharacterized protein LY79DRAFT_326311 [Colletotrichum navitas]|uniref:Secreted protein n=1 Tax=Colletotrichum navitas TaxID=681940 RepID=A0AAD8Q8J3_9PEZI|nr:uncharacterized protein LY79DRAFT_326311 [Colletotrichum navitas]KAK1598028.1 hypothetical protein LY79DRAFT_326311 [Colletotrichum navitas]